MELIEPIEVTLLRGCFLEADRSQVVAYHLEGLRAALLVQYPHLTVTIDEIRIGSRLLRELGDHAQVHFSRIPVVLDYLEIILPCLSRTLRDITTIYEDNTLSKDNRWRKMYHTLTNEADGLQLPQRFMNYNHFLTLLRELLIRSPNFDFNSLENARLQIMKLREAREIPPPPVRVGNTIRTDALISAAGFNSTIHWAEQIFSLPLPSRTALKQQRSSMSFGPHLPWGDISMPIDSRILFLRPFNEGRLSLIVYVSGLDETPYFLLRTFHMGTPWFSLRAVHELCIERDGSCLQFKRWSANDPCPRVWASLCFMTWEELVLLYCSFVSLKARNSSLEIDIAPKEYAIRGEKKLFQARIIDDAYTHSLIVYRDRATRGLRLHAAVWDGPLKRCPVWTAFITHQSASSTWLKRVSRHKVRLHDIQLYVFCQNYEQLNQRRGSVGAFEIYFISEDACNNFVELFMPPESVPSTTTGTTDDQ